MNDITLAKRFVRKAQSSAARGIQFSLTFTEYKRLLKVKKCYYTGVPLSQENYSIDRVDNTKGYITGNVVACDVSFNHLKGSLTPKQVKQLVRGMKRRGAL